MAKLIIICGTVIIITAIVATTIEKCYRETREFIRKIDGEDF